MGGALSLWEENRGVIQEFDGQEKKEKINSLQYSRLQRGCTVVSPTKENKITLKFI